MSAGQRRHRAVLLLVAGLLAVAPIGGSACRGQTEDEIDPTGGLRSRDTLPPPTAGATSREELIRQWDLDFNGAIDASEAAVAKARMRRTRLELETETEIDPLSGKPRSVLDDESEQREVEESTPPVDPATPRKPKASRSPALPGTRVPDMKPGVSGTTPSGAARGSAPAAAGDGRSSRPFSSLAPTRPGARPGYGSISPKPDYNAGMPKPVMGRGGFPGSPGGGLLPTMKSPAARPVTPPPPRPLPQRVTADDIGGF